MTPAQQFLLVNYVLIAFAVLVIALVIFGDKLEGWIERFDPDPEGREERNRAYTAEMNRQGAERDRLRELANAELERLWTLKQKD